MRTRLLLTTMLFFAGTMFSGQLFAEESDTIYLTSKDISGLSKTKNKTYAGIHDPSVVYDPASKMYYIYGTHLGTARSSDMQSWSGLSTDYFGRMSGSNIVKCQPDQAFITNQTTKVNALVNGTVKEVTFGPFDAQAYCTATGTSVYGNMWAPDIIYNNKMKKWCMYLSLNGPRWNCVIILLTSSSITGPFVYQGPVVFSGFNVENSTTLDFTKTDVPIVLGSNTLPNRYRKGNDWGRWWPNCIDPCVHYDANGQLWFVYGSWSGGIFTFKLDENTGLRDYTVTYPETTNSDGHATCDPYFGYHIAGGYYVSGEGPYIQKIGDYYYLFVTNGGLEAKNGYIMRVFRSKNPNGPFVDSKGRSAVYDYYSMNYSTNDAETRGNLIVTSHNFLGFQTTGQVAQGHNSALVDEQGRAYVVYHTRFNTGNEGFQDRVRQLFVNKEGWLCAAPFEFNGETINDDSIKSEKKFSDDQISGTYQVHLLRYKLDNQNLECVTPKDIVLNENGSISGDYTGKWSTTPNTGYISLTVGGTVYSGVVLDQKYDGTTVKSISITASSTTGTCLWAVKMHPKWAIAYNEPKITNPFASNTTVTKNVDLSTETYYGVKSEWVSSRPDVLSNNGRYNPADENVTLTMTHRLVCDNYVYQKDYTVTARADNNLPGDYQTGMVAYYDFDGTPMYNHFNDTQRATLAKQSNGVLPTLVEDGAMSGKVGYLTGGTIKELNGNYFRFPNPLKDSENLQGATISMWVKRMDDNMFGTLWSFTEKLPVGSVANNPHLFITSNNYMKYTNLTDTFCINYPKTAKTDITKGKWVLLTVVISPEDGVITYVNNVKRTRIFESTAGTVLADFDYTKVLETLSNATYFSLGIGNGIAGAQAYFDDLIIYNRALTQQDVALLYAKENRDTDFAAIATGINEIPVANRLVNDGIYDMSGRRVNVTSPSELSRGIYIICADGVSRKVVIR